LVRKQSTAKVLISVTFMTNSPIEILQQTTEMLFAIRLNKRIAANTVSAFAAILMVHVRTQSSDLIPHHWRIF